MRSQVPFTRNEVVLAMEAIRSRTARVCRLGIGNVADVRSVPMPAWGPGLTLVQRHVRREALVHITLVHPSGIEGLIFGSWATLSGERLSCVGPREGPGCNK